MGGVGGVALSHSLGHGAQRAPWMPPLALAQPAVACRKVPEAVVEAVGSVH
jgi:hypothetical protein